MFSGLETVYVMFMSLLLLLQFQELCVYVKLSLYYSKNVAQVPRSVCETASGVFAVVAQVPRYVCNGE